MEITQEELEKIINLHNNSVELLSSLNNNKNQVFAYEYYLISKDWIDNFKNFFHFNGIIGMLTQGRDIKIESIPVIRNLPKINPEEKRKIQIIKNGEIMVKSDRNESIPFCFLNFCLIAPKYYKIITERYNIDQRVKANVYVSKKIFLIDLLNNLIEVGVFNTPYSYKIIFLLQYKEGIKYDDEIKHIFSCNDIYEYLNKFNIPKDMLSKHSEIYRNNFDLIKIYYDENSFKGISNNNKPSDMLKELDITNKLGFSNFGVAESSKLNSIIQMLTSIKEIYYHFINGKKEIKEFNHIYIFSSFFLEAINSAYSKNKIGDISLNQMDIIIKFFDSDISQKDIVEYLKFILQLLHNELLPFPKNLNKESLVSFNSPLEDRKNSYDKFNYYYQNTYQHSVISNLFNWIEEKKVNCNNMYFTSSFQAFPLIEFNFDILFNNQNQNQNQQLTFDINNCFVNYFQIPIKDNPPLPLCQYCNNIHPSNHFIFNTPSYLIIALNRKNMEGIKIKYDIELDLSNFVEPNVQFKKYKLIGVICEENNKYYTIIKNEKGGECSQNDEWKKFDDQNVTKFMINPVEPKSDKTSYNEVFNPTKARILFYKGIY